MAEKKKETQTNIDPKLAIAAAVAIILIAAGAWYFTQPMAGGVVPPQNQTQLDNASAALLLGSYDRMAALQDYHLKYTNTEDGEPTTYDIYKNGANSSVSVTGTFGMMEGFFSANNSTDVVCLTYKNVRKCAMAGNDTTMQEIADSLRIYRSNTKAAASQKSKTEELLGVGAIRFTSSPVPEKVGNFGTEMLAYSLDYRNLTVQQLISIGVQPNDQSIYRITNWVVQNWVDTATGLIVKSSTSYKDNLVPHSFTQVYSEVKIGAPALPPVPANITPAKSFLQFFTDSQTDYTELLNCGAAGNESAACFKTLAFSRQDPEVCRLIKEPLAEEQCTLVLAQTMADARLCNGLAILHDDCYIAVVGENGNSSLCAKLQNQSSLSNCLKAVGDGQKKAEQAAMAKQRLAAGMNCNADTGCKQTGSFGQYCMPLNATVPSTNESSPYSACYAGRPCGCVQGYCEFRQNDTYDKCVDRVDEGFFNNFVEQIKAASNQSAAENSTNHTN
ncbi:Uncharacterised protein [uncultured archaeon]|nr:Uncharacterised protein [uncultured archaeon]